MPSLTVAVVLSLANSCQSLVAPTTILKIAQVESALNPHAVHQNQDKSTDLGLMQINSRNIKWLGLKDPFDPCPSIRAAADLLSSFSQYNSGSRTRSLTYAASVQAVRVNAEPTAIPDPPCPAVDDDDGWHTPALPTGCPNLTDKENVDADN